MCSSCSCGVPGCFIMQYALGCMYWWLLCLFKVVPSTCTIIENTKITSVFNLLQLVHHCTLRNNYSLSCNMYIYFLMVGLTLCLCSVACTCTHPVAVEFQEKMMSMKLDNLPNLATGPQQLVHIPLLAAVKSLQYICRIYM